MCLGPGKPETGLVFLTKHVRIPAISAWEKNRRRSNYPPSESPHLHRPSDGMQLPDFFSLPLEGYRAQSTVRRLRSTARSLSVILNSCDLHRTTLCPLRPLGLSEEMTRCYQAVESLTPRVELLAELLSVPSPEGGVEEGERRTTLKR